MKTEQEIREKIQKYIDKVDGERYESETTAYCYGGMDALCWVLDEADD